jgi:hypothetical protein
MYKVVPFIGRVKSSGSPEDVSVQLTNIITKYESEGWEFVQLGQTTIEVSPGCLAGLLGQKVSYDTFDQIIFKK